MSSSKTPHSIVRMYRLTETDLKRHPVTYSNNTPGDLVSVEALFKDERNYTVAMNKERLQKLYFVSFADFILLDTIYRCGILRDLTNDVVLKDNGVISTCLKKESITW
ncbi:MAG: hypothetical protein IBX57_00460 [Gammaproteobacteria bacterium]|nr:hypothetical protein [Gammaproteobacteria bacterium]